MKLERLKELAGMEQLDEAVGVDRHPAVAKAKAKLRLAVDELNDILVKEMGDELRAAEKLGSILRDLGKEYS